MFLFFDRKSKYSEHLKIRFQDLNGSFYFIFTKLSTCVMKFWIERRIVSISAHFLLLKNEQLIKALYLKLLSICEHLFLFKSGQLKKALYLKRFLVNVSFTKNNTFFIKSVNVKIQEITTVLNWIFFEQISNWKVILN